MNRTIFMLVEEYPHVPGIYIVRDGETPLYVGKAIDIARRIRTHHKLHYIIPYYPNATIEIIEAGQYSLTALEYKYIQELKPLFNETTIGGGYKSHWELQDEQGDAPALLYEKLQCWISEVKKSITYRRNQLLGLHTKVGKMRGKRNEAT